MERTCHRCAEVTFVIFEDKPWCRAHFLAEVQGRQEPSVMPSRRPNDARA